MENNFMPFSVIQKFVFSFYLFSSEWFSLGIPAEWLTKLQRAKIYSFYSFLTFNTIIHFLYNFDSIEWGNLVNKFFSSSNFPYTTNTLTYTKGCHCVAINRGIWKLSRRAGREMRQSDL